MRHAKKRLQLNRFTSWHEATIKSLARSILLNQSIRTSLHKAKAARPLIEQLISLAKVNSLAAKREAFAQLQDHKLVSLLFKDIGPRFANRQGGYTRIIPFMRRRGDGVGVVIFELTEIKKKEIKVHKKQAKEETKPLAAQQENPVEEPKLKKETAVKQEKHPETGKPQKKFLGGIRKIFKKERDSL